jgi:Na+-driven multidrug efflux pump
MTFFLSSKKQKLKIKLYGVSVVLSRYAQCQNRVYPILIIYFIVNLINFGLHALLLYHFSLGVK